MGVTQSALSHSIRGVESRLGVSLFHRTTRSLSTTEAGEALFQKLSPLFDEIDKQINDVNALESVLMGRLRLSGTEHAFMYVLWDKLEKFMNEYPQVQLEWISDSRPVDIVAEHFDAGIRLGAENHADMISHEISPEVQMCVVGSPAYFDGRNVPEKPEDLLEHQCIALKLLHHNSLLDWTFADRKQKGKIMTISAQNQLVVSSSHLIKHLVLSGKGLAWLPRDIVEAEIQAGSLQTVLDAWAISYAGYHLYYPKNRAHSPILNALLRVLRDE